MSLNFLFVLIGALAVCAIGASYLYYQERQSGIDIQIDEKGITIEGTDQTSAVETSATLTEFETRSTTEHLGQ